MRFSFLVHLTFCEPPGEIIVKLRKEGKDLFEKAVNVKSDTKTVKFTSNSDDIEDIFDLLEDVNIVIEKKGEDITDFVLEDVEIYP